MEFPFRDGKGSRAALGGAPREQGGVAREQRASTGEHRGSIEGTRGSTGGAWWSAEGAEREHEAVQERSMWEPEIGFLHLSLSCLLLLLCCPEFATSYRILFGYYLKASIFTPNSMLIQCEIVERIQQAIDSLPGQVLKNIVEETLKLLDFW